MLSVDIDEKNLIAVLKPDGALSANDFETAAKLVDPLIERSGHLNGIIIHTKSFPGWDSFAALISHLRFVKNHHTEVSRMAFVTDSLIGNMAESIGNHFIKAEIKVFPYQEFEAASQWIKEDVRK